MRLIDFYPSQGSYASGETVTFLIELEVLEPQTLKTRIAIRHLAEDSITIEDSFELAAGEQIVRMQWVPPTKPAGYSARLEVLSPNDPSALKATTAFDVLAHWTDFPRYGFLTDFSASRANPEDVLGQLTRFHMNGLQFYDWQYRHDQLLAPFDEYVDPLGREMSLLSVRTLVDTAHRHGMAAMPYLAIYAASADFWHAHPDWALYDDAGQPIAFGENFLGLMDPSAGSAWSKHLLSEVARALEGIPFDGLHIDQYGDPKLAWDSHHQPVDLPNAFVDFIQSASDGHPDKTVLFNAVGNWPIAALADSAVDFLYIEVWPPHVAYRDLVEIVLNGVKLSHGKAVVIALYLPANQPANNLLVDSVIWACGGTRIELGEDVRLLSDPYFPKYEEISEALRTSLRQFYDFTVRNGEWWRPYTLTSKRKQIWALGDVNHPLISSPDSIMAVMRRHGNLLVLQLVNFHGIDSHQRWDQPHAAPISIENVSVQLQMSHRPTQIFWDSPERTDGPQSLAFEHCNGTLTFQIPQIHTIGLIVIYD